MSTRDDAKTLYGYLGWLIDQPEIGPIILRAAEEGWDEARLRGAISKTDWWRQTSDSSRRWDALVAQDQATAEQRVDETALSIALKSGQLGIPISQKRLGQLATSANRFGWNDDEIRLAIVAESRYTPAAAGQGLLGKTMADVRAVAASYLIPVNDQQAWQWARRIAAGAADISAVQAQFAGLAKARFPHLTEDIDAGLTPAQFFTPYRNAIAEILGTSPDQIDLMDRRWSPVISFKSPKEGLRPMTIPESERLARMQPEWRSSDDAWERLTQTAGPILEMFGATG